MNKKMQLKYIKKYKKLKDVFFDVIFTPIIFTFVIL